ncbi:TetR/AcrR family transcriptional regulator [Microbacterium protaetiae]|uniref:TetR/AcrR family transcriptional regulator n=1 Tax=Microbacterium protaetiae TaxID=2509458 RepID=A0A4P6EDQ6_9MICO|nr:TetR/AcrR family transcriptional regulator [Microbacterium protaetiae]QAY60274.1 TetR/AcrR family transcriptional regulator [Microbacterium protaetiae]
MPEKTDARDRLLVAAQALYAERGVAATTPRDVLARSAVGQGSLYHHFPTKRDLARAAVGRTVQEQLGTAKAELLGDATARERIGAYLLRDRDAVAGCRVGRLTSDPLVMSEDDLHRLVEGYFTDLITLVCDVLQEAGLSPDRARERATTIVAVVQGGYVLARATGDPDVMRSAVRGLFALLEEEKE